MKTNFVQVLCDVNIVKWDGDVRYRAYVNGELFTERTWIWRDAYLEEMLQIEAPPGRYKIEYELVQPCTAKMKVKNIRVAKGSAIILDGNIVEVKR